MGLCLSRQAQLGDSLLQAVQKSDFKVLHELLQLNPSLAADAQRYQDGATALHIGASESAENLLDLCKDCPSEPGRPTISACR